MDLSLLGRLTTLGLGAALVWSARSRETLRCARAQERAAASRRGAACFALDLGGSLAKLAYHRAAADEGGSEGGEGGEGGGGGGGEGGGEEGGGGAAGGAGSSAVGGLVLRHFSSAEACVAFIEARGLHKKSLAACLVVGGGGAPSSSAGGDEDDYSDEKGQPLGQPSRPPLVANAVGGGAYKHAVLFRARLGVELRPLGEVDLLVAALCRDLEHGGPGGPGAKPAALFSYSEGGDKQAEHLPAATRYPLLVVNIGTGVSVVKVTGGGCGGGGGSSSSSSSSSAGGAAALPAFERVSGSCLGGGTFLGLCQLLTNKDSYAGIRSLGGGDMANVDLTVGDIYGDRDCERLGLPAALIASSMGKVPGRNARIAEEMAGGGEGAASPPPSADLRQRFAPEDMVDSLIFMLGNNIAQIAALVAQQHGAKAVVYCGGWIDRNPAVWRHVTFGTNFWSAGKLRALFAETDRYYGCIGALRHGGLPAV